MSIPGTTRWRWTATLLLLWGGALMTRTSAAADESFSDQQISGWVRGLGSAKYAERERATRQLAQAGVQAKSQLLAALSSRDAEVRLRSRQLLVDVLERDFQTRVRAFSESADPAKSHDLPCWDDFRRIAGDGNAARRLFVDMLKSEGPLLETFAADAAEASRSMQSRLSGYDEDDMDEIIDDASPSLGRLAAFLFLAQDERIVLDEAASIQIGSLYSENTPGRTLSEPMRRLLGRWLLRPTHGSLAAMNLGIALRQGLEEALAISSQVLARDEQTDPELRRLALLGVARFGKREHLSRVEAFLGDETQCSTFDVDGEEATALVGDAALLAAVRLTKQDPGDYFFEELSPSVDSLYDVTEIGFRDDATRMRAHAKWRAWREKNP